MKDFPCKCNIISWSVWKLSAMHTCTYVSLKYYNATIKLVKLDWATGSTSWFVLHVSCNKGLMLFTVLVTLCLVSLYLKYLDISPIDEKSVYSGSPGCETEFLIYYFTVY